MTPLSEQPGFDQLTPAQRVEVQDWYARRFLATRERGRRQGGLRGAATKLPPIRFEVDRPSKLLQTPAALRDPFTPWYRRTVQRPGSGKHGNTNGQGRRTVGTL